MSRAWAMPNKNTFSIKPIRELILKYTQNYKVIVDPFANTNTLGNITNDLDPDMPTNYHLDALDFLRAFPSAKVDMVLYDPPYSPRQVAECYKKMDMTVNMQTTQSSYWGNQKKEIGRIIRGGGCVISFGWNSGGIGKVHGFEIVEILLVSHGSWHNDTICTVEVKQWGNQS